MENPSKSPLPPAELSSHREAVAEVDEEVSTGQPAGVSVYNKQASPWYPF